MRKEIVCVIVAATGIGLFMRPAGATKNFVPDWRVLLQLGL